MEQNTPNLTSLWRSTLGEIQTDISNSIFHTYINPLRLLKIENGIARIACTHGFMRDQIETKYYNLIKNNLEKRTNQTLSLVFTVQPISKEDKPITDLPMFAPSTIQQTPTPASQNPALRDFSPQFTFDTFAVGSPNQLAFAAAEAVSRTPGQAYNPLFIYGGTGVGKSHLMQAIGHAILSQQPDFKAIFCPGEDFTNEIIFAIRNKTTMKFKQKYRRINLLMLDDIQFLAGKDTAQEEFFHTFNTIHRNGGQIVMTADRPPTELTKLEDRLRSRFQAGLLVDIGNPDFELRAAILLIKSKQKGFDIPMDLAQQVAENILSAREMEGFIMKLKAALMQPQAQLDHHLISELLGQRNQKSPIRQGTRPAEIIKVTADYFGVKISQLKSPSRLARIVLPRQIAMFILKKDLNYQYEAIGDLFKRDHTTIMHGVQKIDKLFGKTPELRMQITGIREALR